MRDGEGGLESSEEYRSLLDHVADLVVVVDTSGEVVYANTTSTRLLGVDPEAMIGESLVEYVHESDTDVIESLLSGPPDTTASGNEHDDDADADTDTDIDTDADGDSFRVQARVRLARAETDGTEDEAAGAGGDDPGEWRWLEFARVADQPSSLDGVVLTARDVTAQKRLTERFRHLVETASDVLVVLDGDGVLKYATPATDRVLGYEHADLVGENVLEYIHPDDREAVAEELSRGLDEPGYTATVEHRFRSSDGEWRWLESRGRSLPETPALEGRIVVVTRDVTERHRREEQVAAQNERLEQFAAMVSHDLQNPLSVASGSLELYRQTGDEAALDRIGQAVERMSELTTDLLELAREGNDVRERTPVDLADCARAALETSPLAAADVTIDPALPRVIGDQTRTRSLFENLFRNVADHAGPDPQVWVESLFDDDGTPSGFAVEDDGPGIAAEDAETVFELGYSSTSGGTGIGLHVVETIAAAHGWDVTVTTGRAGGARFEVRGVEVVSDAEDDDRDHRTATTDADSANGTVDDGNEDGDDDGSGVGTGDGDDDPD